MRLIDADTLIEKFNEKCDMATALVDEKTAERFHTFCVLADAVEDAPTIDAEPIRHGHWKEGFRFSDGGLYQKQCSVCGGWSHDIGNYCPHCGAKMDEETHNEHIRQDV